MICAGAPLRKLKANVALHFNILESVTDRSFYQIEYFNILLLKR